MRDYLFGKRLSLVEAVALGALSTALGAGDIGIWTYMLALLVIAVVATALGENL